MPAVLRPGSPSLPEHVADRVQDESDIPGLDIVVGHHPERMLRTDFDLDPAAIQPIRKEGCLPACGADIQIDDIGEDSPPVDPDPQRFEAQPHLLGILVILGQALDHLRQGKDARGLADHPRLPRCRRRSSAACAWPRR